MKDIIITKEGKNEISATPQTDKAKKIFKKQKCEYGFTVGKDESSKILSWAVSHNLSVESQVLITIPERPRLSSEQLAVIFNTPKNFPQRPLFAFGTAKFKGDNLTGELSILSLNDKFEKGQEYPVYDSEGIFVVGKDGKAYKMTPKAWTQIKPY
jgi:hypothetical protein